MKKFFKRFLYSILILLIIVFVYASVPRVWYKKSPYGTELSKTDIIPTTTQDQLKKYVQDTAQNAQAVIAINKEKIIFEAGDTKRLINCHSARKSIMSLLIGIAKEKGIL